MPFAIASVTCHHNWPCVTRNEYPLWHDHWLYNWFSSRPTRGEFTFHGWNWGDQFDSQNNVLSISI